jgi:dTMP kinase
LEEFLNMRGRLIVFEGGEGAGKTTQLQRSHQWLINSGWLIHLQSKGHIRQIVLTREPGGTETGQRIRQILLEQSRPAEICDRTELLLYAADRAQHVETFLRPRLAAGDLILCDRYTDSTIAYQGYGRGLDLSLIEQLNQIATNGLQSDLTLWLDLEVETGLARTRQRGEIDRIEQADRTFHYQVRQGFTTLAATFPDRIVPINANQPADLVAQQIQATLKKRFQQWFGTRFEF